MTVPTAEQRQQILSIKRSLEIIFAALRNCEDEETAEDVYRQAQIIREKLYVLEGTPQAAVRLAA